MKIMDLLQIITGYVIIWDEGNGCKTIFSGNIKDFSGINKQVTGIIPGNEEKIIIKVKG